MIGSPVLTQIAPSSDYGSSSLQMRVILIPMCAGQLLPNVCRFTPILLGPLKSPTTLASKNNNSKILLTTLYVM